MTEEHLSIDELADAAEGLLDPERAALAASHIAGCAGCRAQSEAYVYLEPVAVNRSAQQVSPNR